MKYYLLGGVIGDTCGSRFEWKNSEDIADNFRLITSTSDFTDDTILTMAVAESLLKDRPYSMMIKKFARKYPHAGYGGMFKQWMLKQGEQPAYNSFGNGGAMRLLAIPLYFDNLTKVLIETVKQASCTHNHTESLESCMLLAHTIFLAKTIKDKSTIYKEINRIYGYECSLPGDPDIRKNSLKSKDGVWETLHCFFNSDDYISALRMAVKFGGDTDTIACMTGGLSYVFYEEIPLDLIQRVLIKLPEDYRQIIKKFATKTEKSYGNNKSKNVF